jgi:hypothetical protein
MCREPNQQSRVLSFAWDVESSRQSRWAGVVAFMFRTPCFQFRRELTTQSHLSALGRGLLLAQTPDLRPPARKSQAQPSLRRLRASKGANGPIRTHTEVQKGGKRARSWYGSQVRSKTVPSLAEQKNVIESLESAAAFRIDLQVDTVQTLQTLGTGVRKRAS